MSQALLRLPAALLVLWLIGCATQPSAPIDAPQRRETATQPVRPPPPPVATVSVRRGDTLYAIAFARGLDFRDVARWNAITAPFTIYPGQVLRLGPSDPEAGSAVPVVAAAPAAGTGTASVRVVGHVPAPVTAAQSAGRDPVFVPIDRPEVAAAGVDGAGLRDGQASKPAVAAGPVGPVGPGASTAATVPGVAEPVTVTPPERVAAVAPAAPTPPAAGSGTNSGVVVSDAPLRGPGSGKWLWPTDGQVLEAFGSGGRKGVVVGGRSGQPIRAARAGEVVYAGGGLLGYGLLVIVKHDDTFLSAYGNNSRLLVKEGARVDAGQSIAEMGASADGRIGLHFELRRKGQPIDPLVLVPAP